MKKKPKPSKTATKPKPASAEQPVRTTAEMLRWLRENR